DRPAHGGHRRPAAGSGRCVDPREGRGQRRRRARDADLDRPHRRRTRRVPECQQTARREHHRGGRSRPRAHPTAHWDPGGRAPRHHARPIGLHPPGDPEPLARGAAGLRSRVPGDPDLPALADLDPHHLHRHPTLDPALVHLPLLPRSVAQRLHAGRPRPRGGAPGRRLDRGAGEHQPAPEHPGTSRRRAVLDAAREVAMPIFSATITTIIVFLPTVFLEGQIKLLFIPLTFTISVSLFASFLVSRTVTPLLALRVLRPEKPVDPRSRRLRDRVFRLSQRFFEGTEELYQRLIEWALGHRGLVVGSIAVTFVGSLGLVAAPWLGMRPLIGTEFFPPSDEAQFRIDLKAPIGTRVEETERTVRGMENIVRAT